MLGEAFWPVALAAGHRRNARGPEFAAAAAIGTICHCWELGSGWAMWFPGNTRQTKTDDDFQSATTPFPT